MIPRRIAQLGRPVYPRGLWEGPTDRHWVALTFDDGPHPEVTPRVLEVLRRTDVPATFFAIGARAARHPELLQRIQAEGHEIGNHTWSHRPLAWGTWPSPRVELERTEELLARVVPGSPRIFRPPFGAIGPGGRRALVQTGLLPVYWSIVPADWDPLSPQTVVRRVMRQIHPGAVIVLHAGQPWHSGSIEAVEPLIHRLRGEGYDLVSLGTMLSSRGYAPGVR